MEELVRAAVTYSVETVLLFIDEGLAEVLAKAIEETIAFGEASGSESKASSRNCRRMRILEEDEEDWEEEEGEEDWEEEEGGGGEDGETDGDGEIVCEVVEEQEQEIEIEVEVKEYEPIYFGELHEMIAVYFINEELEQINDQGKLGWQVMGLSSEAIQLKLDVPLDHEEIKTSGKSLIV